jgi:hypothetical protein
MATAVEPNQIQALTVRLPMETLFVSTQPRVQAPEDLCLDKRLVLQLEIGCPEMLMEYEASVSDQICGFLLPTWVYGLEGGK